MLASPHLVVVGSDGELVAELSEKLRECGVFVRPGIVEGQGPLPDLLVVAPRTPRTRETPFAMPVASWLRGVPLLGVFVPEGLAAPGLVGQFDDFVVWPCHHNELWARVARLIAKKPVREPQVTQLGTLIVDAERHEASVDGRPMELRPLEFRLLQLLAAQPGKVVGRDRLYKEIWGMTHLRGLRTVDVHVRRLRAKLGPDWGERLITIRKVGYRLNAPE
jgi:hypothetical protein